MHELLNDDLGLGGKLRIDTFKEGKIIRSLGPIKNKVVSSSGYGRNIIARQLIGDTSYAIQIDSASIGTGTTAPADSDTGLVSVSASGLTVTNASVSNNVVTIEFFVPDGSLSNGTYKEFGVFANSRLIARLLISPNYTKGAGEDTLFTYTLTLSG